MTDTTIIYTLVSQVFDYNINRYLIIKEVTKTITKEVYNNITSKETIKFFRKLGGTEKVTHEGRRVKKLVSTSPSGEQRIIRTFVFSD